MPPTWLLIPIVVVAAALWSVVLLVTLHLQGAEAASFLRATIDDLSRAE